MNNLATNFGYIPKPSDIQKYTSENINYGSLNINVKNEIKEKTN
jgi:hypothetical protein